MNRAETGVTAHGKLDGIVKNYAILTENVETLTYQFEKQNNDFKEKRT